MFKVTYWLTEDDDDNYDIYNWFEDAGECLEQLYETADAANAALSAQYIGPDPNGVEVRWKIEPAQHY